MARFDVVGVDIELNASRATEEARKFAEEIKKTTKRADELIERIEKHKKVLDEESASVTGAAGAWSGLAGQLLGVFSAYKALQFLKSATTLAIQQEQAVSRLSFAFNRAKVSQQDLTRAQQFAASVATETATDIVDVTNAMGLLATITGATGLALERATRLTVDYSFASGKTLKDAATGVAKVMQGNNEVLRENGILLQENETALDALTRVAKGSAKTFGDTLPGQLRKTTNELREMKRTVGELVLEILGPLAVAFNTLRDFDRSTREQLQKERPPLKEFIEEDAKAILNFGGPSSDSKENFFEALARGALELKSQLPSATVALIESKNANEDADESLKKWNKDVEDAKKSAERAADALKNLTVRWQEAARASLAGKAEDRFVDVNQGGRIVPFLKLGPRGDRGGAGETGPLLRDTKAEYEGMIKVTNDLKQSQQDLSFVWTDSTSQIVLAVDAASEAYMAMGWAAAQAGANVLVAALLGEKAQKGALRAALKSIASEAFARALFETAAGLGSLAIHDYEGATKHFQSAAAYGIAGAVATAGAAISPQAAATGGGGRGAGRATPEAPTTGGALTPPPRETIIRIYINTDGVVTDTDSFAREIAEKIRRESEKTGRAA